MREQGLHTICEEAACPNIGECWGEFRTASFLLLGDTCTRNCGFCDVTTGRPGAVDWTEPQRLAEAVARLELRHVVITSVTRDDLRRRRRGNLRHDDPRSSSAAIRAWASRC